MAKLLLKLNRVWVSNFYLVELFKNHKLIKIFQKEEYEKNRADILLSNLKEKSQKIHTVFVRMSPVMETLTGIMIAVLIFYSGLLMSKGELEINNFFLSSCDDACISTSKIFIHT